MEFEVSYSTDTEYNMEDLTPDSWKKLSKKYVYIMYEWVMCSHRETNSPGKGGGHNSCTLTL